MTTYEKDRFREGSELYLHEELLLLALSEKGTMWGSTLPYALASAVLGELLIRERIVVAGKDKPVEVVRHDAIGEPLLDECLERIVHAKKPHSLQSWVMKFASIKKLKHRIAEGLCRQRITQAREDTVLVIFRRTLYPQINRTPKKRTVERLRKAIFRGTRELDARTVVLVSLAHGAGLLPQVFDKHDLGDRKERLDAIGRGEVAGAAASGAIQAAQAAAMVTVIAASAAAASSSSSRS